MPNLEGIDGSPTNNSLQLNQKSFGFRKLIRNARFSFVIFNLCEFVSIRGVSYRISMQSP
jgi:hypothetical protein